MARAQNDNAPVDDVKTMQQRLAELNYYSAAIDGWLGPQTDRAVKDFQAKYFSPTRLTVWWDPRPGQAVRRRGAVYASSIGSGEFQGRRQFPEADAKRRV